MQIDYHALLRKISPEMNRTRVAPDAVVGYDVLADALVWSDEYPPDIAGRLCEFDCLKLVLRYRTTLLLDVPDRFFRPYWDTALACFPDWAGFCETRLNPTEELQRFYAIRKERDEHRLERIDRVCKQDKNRSHH